MQSMIRKAFMAMVLYPFATFQLAYANLDPILAKEFFCKEMPSSLGPLTIVSTGSEFHTITEADPGYIRVGLANATLGSTLVSLGGPPILLQARVWVQATGDFQGRLLLQPQDVAIVRWISGENAFWIKVSSPATQWLEDATGSAMPPNERVVVAWTVGIHASEWASSFDFVPPLPGPNLAMDGLPANTHSSMILSQSDFQDSISVDVLGMHGTLGVETEEDPANIIWGIPYGQFGPTSRPVLDCNRMVLPWISYSQQFQSTVVLNNPTGAEHLVNVMAYRDGMPYERHLTLPAGGFVALGVPDLFDFLEPGPGMTWFVDSAMPGLKGSWITEGLTGASGRSPAKALAVALDSSDLVGQELLFSALPLREDTFASIVLANTGSQATDIALTVRSEDGQILAQDSASFRQWPPHQPLAVLVRDLFPAELDIAQIPRVSIQAVSGGEALVGAEFSFNEQREPAINNAVKIR